MYTITLVLYYSCITFIVAFLTVRLALLPCYRRFKTLSIIQDGVLFRKVVNYFRKNSISDVLPGSEWATVTMLL